MWQTEYHSRLGDWYSLRQTCELLSFEEQLHCVNNWWFRAPIVNRSIRWNESVYWPDPWELLTNSGYCDLARALGIMYTLMMLEKRHYKTVEIVESCQDNLVLVDSGKYILNWAPGEILNIHSKTLELSQRIDSAALVSFKP
jgi:hypothetical protein